ncbi:MAG: flagellar hook-associated protein FlgK [Nitrospirae bacterium]|nr:flagellar hook-associated protein FlgK [Candidatus Manganitrophaceae bacterium]
MAGISNMFNVGRLALFANQKGLEVTSQNIANINTPGYTRQAVSFNTTTPLSTAPGQTGTGVEISEIRRVVNRFIESQITSGESSFGRLETESGLLNRVESIFSAAGGSGLNLAISDLFSALQDVSNAPADRPARTVLLERAKQLSQQIVTADTQFRQIRTDANKAVLGVLNDVNLFASQVATLNDRIKVVNLSGQNANDLLDQRQVLINKISERIDIQTIEDSFGQTTIFVGNGKALVEGKNAGSLVAAASADNDGFSNISFRSSNGSLTDITSAISNGSLSALIDVRDNKVPGFMDQLDQLSASLVNEFNQVHSATGTAFDLNGIQGGNFFGPLAPTARGLTANTGSGVLGVTVATPSALTLDKYRVTLSGTNYTVTNLTTGASSTPGTLPQTFEGLSISISSGTPASGDVFNVSAHLNTARSMSVAITDPDSIAASSSATGVPGNNVNMNLLAGIQNNAISALNGDTLQTYYGGFVGDVGTQTQSSQRALSVETDMRTQLKNMRQEISGVSMDEEMTNIIKFQRAYEAAATVITTADEMFQTILALRR